MAPGKWATTSLNRCDLHGNLAVDLYFSVVIFTYSHSMTRGDCMPLDVNAGARRDCRPVSLPVRNEIRSFSLVEELRF